VRVPIVPEFAMKLGWAAGKVLAASRSMPRWLLVKTRACRAIMLESALQSGLCAAGRQMYAY
jgi:phosphoglucosamine mutase